MLTDSDDDEFWQQAVKDVRKMAAESVVAPAANKKINIQKHRQYATKQEFSTYSKFLDDFAVGGIDVSTMRKFKKEEFKVEAVLDLHGLTEDEAYAKVDEFIVQSYNQGKRCVVIVTGKGLTVRDDDDIFTPKGVLKRQVPQWLNMPRLRAMIMVFKNPSARLGGSGALYVLLKRNKEY